MSRVRIKVKTSSGTRTANSSSQLRSILRQEQRKMIRKTEQELKNALRRM